MVGENLAKDLLPAAAFPCLRQGAHKESASLPSYMMDGVGPSPTCDEDGACEAITPLEAALWDAYAEPGSSRATSDSEAAQASNVP